MSRVKYSHTCTARGSDTDGVSHKTPVFVANVNVDGGKLKVNVNRFDYSNVWNGDNRHRLVVPLLGVSPALWGGSFFSKPIFQPWSIRPIL